MKKSDRFQPLSNLWDIYNESLDIAIERDYISNPEMAEGYVWPHDLKLSESEKEDIQSYVHERLREIVDRLNEERTFNPHMVASYIFRSVIVGMLLSYERKGR